MKIKNEHEETKPKVSAANLKNKKGHEAVNTDLKKRVLLEKLNTVNIPLNPPQTANVDFIQEDQENGTDYANLTPEDKDRKQKRILHSATEIEKFLTEFED